MQRRNAHDLEAIMRAALPQADLKNLRVERISHRRNADHFRVRVDGDSLVVRLATREGSAHRIITALTALEDTPFAPQLRASSRLQDGTFLIAMDDLGDVAPTSADIQAELPDFTTVIRAIHSHQALADAIERVGRAEGDDSSMAWAEEEWTRLQQSAADDPRVALAANWMRRAREHFSRREKPRDCMVSGHGDLHAANWRLTPRGLALIDWEEIRRWPLASELADFIVFGQLDPVEVTRLYGAPTSYAEYVRREAASCALSFYLYWLRTTLDASDPRPESLEEVRIVCDRLFRS